LAETLKPILSSFDSEPESEAAHHPERRQTIDHSSL